ncbi:Uma2 family endonuclease [Mucilaginibacter psychrotolerans]|nr:Uma2 family endonuclease [Mucilaginibacter psychrotolerans]
MLTAEKKKKYTVEDYMLLEEGAPFQLINYDLVMSPSPIPLHQVISIRFSNALVNFLDAIGDNGFIVAAPMDVKFDEGNVLQPDILYITESRAAEMVTTRVEGAPDLVVEILSPSTAYYDLRQKKDIYEKYGVKEYIIIDPIQENAEVHIIKDDVYVLHQKAQKTDTLHSVVLPGFSFDLNKIFR